MLGCEVASIYEFGEGEAGWCTCESSSDFVIGDSLFCVEVSSHRVDCV